MQFGIGRASAAGVVNASTSMRAAVKLMRVLRVLVILDSFEPVAARCGRWNEGGPVR